MAEQVPIRIVRLFPALRRAADECGVVYRARDIASRHAQLLSKCSLFKRNVRASVT